MSAAIPDLPAAKSPETTVMTPSLRVRNGDIELAVYTWGPAGKKPTVVLVHGYPDSAHIWQSTAEILARDFHVVAYDVRGCGQSSIPKAVKDFEITLLMRDLEAVLDAVSPKKSVHLVAHDWGSIQCWEAVTTAPLQHRIASYHSISGPSLDHIGFWMRDRLGSGSVSKIAQVMNQLRRSWYMGFFQIPGVESSIWQTMGEKAWPKLMRFMDGTQAEMSATQIKDGSNGINLYRANIFQRIFNPQQRHTEVPVQLIVPTQDPFANPDIYNDLPRWASKLWRRDIAAGHWVPLSHPALIAQHIAEFVRFVESGEEPAALQRARVTEHTVAKKPWAGKVVLVTGGGAGIGRETLLMFAEQGATVIAADLNLEAAEQTAELSRQRGAPAWARQVDVGSADAMAALATWVGEAFGAPDVVINNAGIGISGAFLDTTEADWDKVLRVNLWGVIHGSRLFGRQMVATGKAGHIVNIASMAAFTPLREMPAYATSKAAVLMLSDCLRAELAERSIKVISICPGMVDTGITQSTHFVGVSAAEQARRRALAKKVYQRRNLKPQKVAEAIFNAVQKNRPEVLVGIEAHASRFISRFAPVLSRRLARLDMPN